MARVLPSWPPGSGALDLLARFGAGGLRGGSGTEHVVGSGPFEGRTPAFGRNRPTPRRWPACHRNGQSAAEEPPGAWLDASAAGVVRLVRPPCQRRERQGSISAPRFERHGPPLVIAAFDRRFTPREHGAVDGSVGQDTLRACSPPSRPVAPLRPLRGSRP